MGVGVGGWCACVLLLENACACMLAACVTALVISQAHPCEGVLLMSVCPARCTLVYIVTFIMCFCWICLKGGR